MQIQTKSCNIFLTQIMNLNLLITCNCKDDFQRLVKMDKIFVTPTFKSGLRKSLIWAFGICICLQDWLGVGLQIL